MVSKKFRTLFLVAVVMLFSLSLIAADRPGVIKFKVTMTGAAEAPGPGDPDGTGTALIKISPEAGRICWSLKVSGIDLPATAAHIHVAPAGSPGGVVVPLSAPDEKGKTKGCADASSDLLNAIVANPGAYYVNVHNAAYPAGAVRDQLNQ